MHCPLYSQTGTRCRCLAVRGYNTPTLHERESYCTTGTHPRCPTMIARIRKGRELSEADYLAVWAGDADAPTIVSASS